MLINVGDRIQNSHGDGVSVTSIHRGKYGLRILGKFESGNLFYTFVPWELPPVEKDILNWNGPWRRGSIELLDGMKLGATCLKRRDNNPHSIEEYDLEWERTIEQMREGGNGQS